MKKIDNCENSTVLVGLLLAGILLVMGGYRIFSYLCDRGAVDTATYLLGAAALVLAIFGLLLASRSFRRLPDRGLYPRQYRHPVNDPRRAGQCR